MTDFIGPPSPIPPIVRHLETARKKPDLHPALKYGPVAANLYDAIATTYGISNGGEEANPVMAPFVDNTAAFYGAKVGSGLISGLAADALAKRGHRNWAKILAGLSIGVPLGAGTHNLVQGRKQE